MANSLRAKLSKLRHDRHITDAEYKEFIKKIDGHDRELRNKAIDEFTSLIAHYIDLNGADGRLEIDISEIDEIAEQMKGGNE